jgi:hypothetical protein
MAREINAKLEYSAEKDVLFIIALPEREVETRTMGYNHGLLVFHEKHNPHTITGIEVFDFSKIVGELERENITMPEFDFTFNVIGASLRGVHFADLLKWAYGQFVAEAQLVAAA